MAYIDFVGRLHTATERDYVQRVVEHDKAACAEVAGRFDKDYWDGDRRYGFGGYRYDGRWRPVAEAMVAHYDLQPEARILDVGCGKGFLLYEFTQVLPGVSVAGIDVSTYGVAHAKEEIRSSLTVGTIADPLPYDSSSFDLVYSINTLHNLYNYELSVALSEIERVCAGAAHITIESYRNEQEKANLLYWQLTCRAFMMPAEWEWAFTQAGYTGDYGCIYFT
jgi:protein-L-isoaspartate(D-aspartate) O-methyltransferase